MFTNSKTSIRNKSKKLSKKIAISIKGFLLLIFLNGLTGMGAFAQNSCAISGATSTIPATPPFPTEIIVSCADGANLFYQSNPSLPSTFSWAFIFNTSGASIVGSSTGQNVEVNPGNAAGSFFLVCTVVAIAPPNSQNQCAVSVAVFKPLVNGVPASRCGPGTITLGATGCSGTVKWYDAPSGGNLVHTGSSFTTNVTSTTSYWASCTISVTPQPPSLPFDCVSPRVEVVATVNPLPICSITGGTDVVCAGSTTTWCATAGMASYSWTGPGGFTASTQCVTIGTAGTYTVTITDANGCQSTCARILTVNPNSTASAGPPASQCRANGLTDNTFGTNTFTVNGSGTNGTPSWSVLTNVSGYTVNILNPSSYSTNVEISGTLVNGGSVTLRLTVTNSFGCANATSDVILTLNPLPLKRVLVPSNFCPSDPFMGGSLTLQNAQINVSYQLLLDNVPTQAPQTPVVDGQNLTWTNLTAGSYTVAGSYATNCNTTSGPAPIVENNSPLSNAGLDKVQCFAAPSGPTVFTITGVSAFGTTLWSQVAQTGTANATINTPASLTTTVDVSGTGTVTLRLTTTSTATPPCGNAIDDVVLTVYAQPACDITGGNNAVCAGFTTTWCATAGMASYSWTGPGGFTANTECITIGIAGTYIVTITDANGCQSTCQRALTVNLPPPCDITGGSNAVCAGFTTTWCATAGMASYAWTGPGGFTANTQCVTIGTAGTYIVTITDANGCQSNCQRTLTVNPPPPCTITGGSNAVCAGSTTTWCATTGMTTYSWTGPGGFTANTECITIGTAGTYIVTITDATGCQSTCQRTLTVNTVTCNMVAPAAPQCSLAGNTVSGTVSGGTTPYTCTASFDAAGTAAGWVVTNCSVTGSNISVTYTSGTSVATILTVIVTDANGCSSQCTISLNCQSANQGCSPGFWKNHTQLWDQASDFIVTNMPGVLGNKKFITTTNFYTYFNLPAGWASANGFPSTITMLGAISQGGGACKAFARHAVSSLLTSVSGLNMPYPAGTSDFTSLYNAIRAALIAGDCSGTLFNQLAAISNLDGPWCSALKNLRMAENITATPKSEDVSRANQFSIFPNPAENNVNITFVPAKTDNSSVALYDKNGNLVSYLFNGMTEGGNTYQRKIDTRSLTSGVYIIKFQNGNVISNQKLVITK